MLVRIIGFILILLTVAVVPYALQRDIHFEKAYCLDLRNRVVGARLIKDGFSPYFYKWTNGAPLRYYDPLNFNNTKPSVITSSPFLHRLFEPLAELQEASISRIWLGIEYGVFLLMIILAFRLTETAFQRQAIIFLSLLFLLTNAWKIHVAKGQSYICIPFLAMIFFYCMREREKKMYALAAGVIATSLVLIKIYAFVFFIPFLFLIGRYSRSWLLVFFTPVLAAAIWIGGSSRERSLWLDYKEQVAEWTDIFSGGGDRLLQKNQPNPHILNIEGIDMVAADKEKERQGPNRYYIESGNFYIIYLNIFHHFVPPPLLGIAALSSIILLTVIFYYRNRPYDTLLKDPDLSRIAIFGFCLYMLADLYSPIFRSQYYEVQWIFPLLLAAATFRREKRVFYMILLVGLFLNIVHLPFIKMGNTIGEYLILLCLLGLSLFPLSSTTGATSPAEV